MSVVCIYRRRNASLVLALLSLLPMGTPVALWGLDGIEPSLEAETVGEGPGLRVHLLNRLAVHVRDRPGYLVMVDDDISFRRGSIVDLVKAADLAELDVSQPAQAFDSNIPVRFTRRRPLSFAIRTHFVESGPCVALSEHARKALLPLPTDTGMGWGLEGHWGDPELGLRLGIVDALPLTHHGPAGVSYDVADAEARNQAALHRAGICSWTEWQTVDAVWRPWQKRAPWVH
jgi:hypothetical protein